MSSNQNMPQLEQGDLVAGRFRIVESIGSGGFSVVYRAHQEAKDRFVALKVLKPAASSDEKIVERFRREALFASHLSHPNTITLFDYGHTDGGLCYIAMELLDGQDLADVVQRGEPVDLERVWSILHQCCQSLAEAHRLGLVHRDLKPENIFLVQRGDGEFVKVLDFGVSKAISNFANAGPRTMAPLTQEGTVFGTPLYMAPEQAMAEGIAPSVDVYALGHIAYEMITGAAAYGGCTNAMDVMLKQINEPPLALPEPWSQTPFSPLITKCTAKEPEGRIPDASKLLEHLLHDAFIPYMDDRTRPRTPSAGRRDLVGAFRRERGDDSRSDASPTPPGGADPDAQASPALRGRAYKIMADLAVSHRRFEEAKSHYRSARDSFREAGQSGARVAAMGAMGHCALMAGKAGEAEEILSAALERAEQLQNQVLGARLGRFMGQVLMRQARFVEASGHLRASLQTFEKIDSHTEVVETLSSLGDADFAATDYGAARDQFRRALAVASSGGGGLDESAHLGLGRALAALGRLDQARTHFREGLERGEAFGDRLQEARIHFHLGDVELAAARFERARRHFGEVEQVAERVAHTELLVEASIRRAYVSLHDGDSAGAYEKLSEAMQLAESLSDADGELRARAHIIYLQLLEHDFRTRGATFAPLIDQCEELGLPRARVLCQLFTADVHAARGERKRALRLLGEARPGAAQLRDYALVVPITRRVRLFKGHQHPGDDGFAIGALVPPELGRRRLGTRR